MIVAAGATQREAKECHARCIDAVYDGFDSVLLEIDAALEIQQRVAVKARRHDLVVGGIRQHVPGDLLDDKLVERQVAVQGANQPFAVHPNLALAVGVVAVGVGVARQVEPVTAPAFSVVRRFEQVADDLLIGVRTCIF